MLHLAQLLPPVGYSQPLAGSIKPCWIFHMCQMHKMVRTFKFSAPVASSLIGKPGLSRVASLIFICLWLAVVRVVLVVAWVQPARRVAAVAAEALVALLHWSCRHFQFQIFATWLWAQAV